jgi:hypothetical protein
MKDMKMFKTAVNHLHDFLSDKQQKSYNCKFCKQKVPLVNLNSHFEEDHDLMLDLVACPFEDCETTFSCEDKSDLLMHIKQAHLGHTLSCRICNEYFSNEKNLDRHEDQVHRLRMALVANKVYDAKTRYTNNFEQIDVR